MHNSSSPSHPLLDDPRTRADFNPLYYPRVNGQEAPPLHATERNARVTLEFLRAYYNLNREYARLLEVRSRPNPQSGSSVSSEKDVLQAIERLLIERDRLEDEYAPLGVLAEPVVNDGFTVAIRISFGNRDAAGRLRSELFTLSTCVPIPLPSAFKFEHLPLKIHGPGVAPE